MSVHHSTTPPLHHSTPLAWTIAGTDPSGGAGIQADLKVMNALGVYGCSVITAVIAQNTRGVHAVEFPSESMLDAQLRALQDDLPPVTVKLGMLSNAATVRTVTRYLKELGAWVVCDPVLLSSSGTPLLEADALDVFAKNLLPHVDLLTPNIPEAEALLGRPITDEEDAQQAAQELLERGPRSVLVKGGHREGSWCQDFWTDGTRKAWLTLPRIDTTSTHGTGCVLSSAIAACRALGYVELDAIVVARAYLNQGLRTAPEWGRGKGPLNIGPWPAHPDDLPRLTGHAEEGRQTYQFADCGNEPMGLYPIVDRVDWVKKLLPLGITTIQLRIKDRTDVDADIREAINFARNYPRARLFINDQWDVAIKHDAYGVHIGQDDLETADLDAIEKAGLRLGLSTHSYAEIARARACSPSYIAIGTVFRTTTKVMDYPPLGLDEFRRMRKLLGIPTVAIGGIHLEQAPDVLAAGADGLAVISEVTETSDVEKRIRQWQDFLQTTRG